MTGIAHRSTARKHLAAVARSDNNEVFAPSGTIPMMDATLPTTRITLLTQLRRDPSDQAGWDEFVERYGRHIFRWCRQWKLQDADAEDVTQDILVKLTQKLRSFEYDPSRSFRGWLKTVAHHAWRDFEDSRRRAHAATAEGQESILTLEAREDLVRKLEEAFDLELLETAKARVQMRVAPHTWEAFRLVALEGRPVAEVAPIVQMQVAMVYVARSKVQKMLQEEIRKLEMGM
jgi:RNA polymerase sigma-70 factor (ECF subfamily)